MSPLIIPPLILCSLSTHHPVLCSLTTLRHSHTYPPSISCTKVLILSSSSCYLIYLHSGSGKRFLVYSAKTIGPIPSIPPDSYFRVQCLLVDESYLSTNVIILFFCAFRGVPGQCKAYKAFQIPFLTDHPSSLRAMAPCKTKQPFEPSSSAAPAAVGRPNAKASCRLNARGSSRARSKVNFLDPFCTLRLETYLLI